MSAWESVPFADDDWAVMTEDERDAYLVDAFTEIRDHWYEARRGHDQRGWYAEDAGSAACRALGHDEDDFDNPDTHPSSFDGDPLCAATKYGTLCTECEGECEYAPPHLLWVLPGVLVGASS